MITLVVDEGFGKDLDSIRADVDAVINSKLVGKHPRAHILPAI